MITNIPQAEADALLAMEKYADNEVYLFPLAGSSLRIPMHSQDKREEFYRVQPLNRSCQYERYHTKPS